MGYWSNGPDSKGEEMIWGDEPADIMGDALDKIITVFIKYWDRMPTEEEIMRGLKFSVAGALEDYWDYHKKFEKGGE